MEQATATHGNNKRSQLFRQRRRGLGMVVATLDTGVDASHPDLGPRWRGGGNSWLDPNGQHAGPADTNGHGTGVMGLIVGGDAGGYQIGMAPDATWIAAKIFDNANQATLSGIYDAYQWLLDPDGNSNTDDAPDIVNNSWDLANTANQCNQEFAEDLALLAFSEIAVVFAGGNYGPNPDTSVSPANDPSVLAVGSVDSSMNIDIDSSRGTGACDSGVFPHLVAPGDGVLTADRMPIFYNVMSGTSFAVAHVAGGMALLKGAFPEASVSQLQASFTGTAEDLGAQGPDHSYGHGLIHLPAAHEWLVENLGGGPGSLQFGATDYSVDENVASLTVTVTRTGGSSSEVSVDYASSDDSPSAGSATAGADYTATSGTLIFPDGGVPSSQTFTVTILDDLMYEGDEDLNLALSNPTGGATLGTTANATLIILDDDPPPNDPPTITSSPVTTATEGEPYSYDVAASDPDQSDVLTFSLDASSAGMNIDSLSGLIDWIPNGQTGSNAVTVRVTDAGGLFDTQSFTIDVSQAPPGVQLYFSTETNATIPGVSGPNDDADIYHWDGSGYSRVFDASAAGLPGNADVDALVVDGAVYYLSFRRNGGTNVPGLGLVDDEDIVKYEAGAWSLYFDGGAVGLADSNGEDVDSFELLANGDILVSIVGSAKVPGLGGTYRDEDLLRCQPAAVPVTSCSWSMYFDGSDVVLNNSSGEDVDGVSVSASGSIQLSTVGAFNVAGLSGNDEDVFVCNAPTTGTSTACTSFTMLFEGVVEGIADDLDAIDLP